MTGGAARAVVELTRICWVNDRARLLGALALMLAEAAALPLTAPALGALTDAAVAGDAARAGRLGALVALLAIAALTGEHFAHVLYFELGDKAFLHLDREVIALSNGSAGLAHHERAEYADRIAVLRQELNRVGNAGVRALLGSLTLGCAVVLTAVLLARLNPWLLLLPLAAVPPILAGRYAESLTSARRMAAAADTRAAQHMFDLARNAATAKELRVLGLRDLVVSRHERHWRAATRRLWGGEARAMLLRAGGQLVFSVCYVVGTLLVVRDAVTGRCPVGEVVLVVVLAAQVNGQVTGAVTLLQEHQRLARTMAELRWVRALVAGDPAPTAPAVDAPAPTAGPAAASASVPARLTDGIRLRGVSFRYPDGTPGAGADVLRGVDLRLPAGATVAIVGENGAGKSTLVKLLCRFYEPTAGVIELDGVDLRSLPVDRWRERIAAGFQDFSRFELLARETVGVGDLPRLADEGAVAAALDRAGAADVVSRLAQGLATPLGLSQPGGTELSGGQWQKLALGRAMMRETPLLLVLDEPTAALDAEAEHRLFERYAAGARRLGRRTGAVTLLVSHRFSTVRMADLILVMSGCRITESGSHAELMAAGGLYAELYRLQADQYA